MWANNNISERPIQQIGWKGYHGHTQNNGFGPHKENRPNKYLPSWLGLGPYKSDDRATCFSFFLGNAFIIISTLLSS